MNTAVRDAIFGLGSFIRYVAFGDGQRVETAQRDGIADAAFTDAEARWAPIAPPRTPGRRVPSSRFVALDQERCCPREREHGHDVALRCLDPFPMTLNGCFGCSASGSAN
jgi:hypothetical protein